MRLVAISVETTGPKFSDNNRIVEIGCAEVIDGIVTERYFHVYLNSPVSIEESWIDVCGLTPEFLLDKPTFHDIAQELIEYIGHDEIILYNATHVLPFIHQEFGACSATGNISFDNDYVDILSIGNERHPDQNNSLANLCERYYVNQNPSELYGALRRAKLIADVFLAFRNEDSKKITSDLTQFREGDNLIVVKTFAEFDKAIEPFSKSALCRGVSNHEYPLLPSLFRHSEVENADLRERNLMWVFKTHAKAHLPNVPQSELEWLIIGQHHGLPTRLLDWSLSPLVACFFAVQSLSEDDAAVYIYDIGDFKKEEDVDLSKLEDIIAIFPSHNTKRVTAQSGMFTIHPSKDMKLETSKITKIKIPSNRKQYFMDKLIKYGVHQGTIFPDLDGLSNYIKFLNDY
ncbi:FRG domain-containing protein [Thalassotalea sp. G2M2-11]|uniref:FRG domain-containing protein n=1 Tax=Thalassotalea sp. G2M2-11 TaxID=2787627 RepID=UPI0019D02680|nr:FRG domain-containing protein [Thalassotalea sp. G2M2-11]